MAEARQNLSGRPRVAVTFSPAAEMRDAIVAVLEGVAEVDFTAEAETVAEAVASGGA